jgi:hypothetical protein
VNIASYWLEKIKRKKHGRGKCRKDVRASAE